MEQFLVFDVDSQQCAIRIADVKEVLRNTHLNTIPEQPKFIEGLLNLRGEMIPVINLRTRFLAEEEKLDINHRILVVLIDEQRVGLKVDCVDQVRELDVSVEIKKHLKKIALKEHFIEGVSLANETLTVVINVNEIFNEIEADLISTIRQEN